MDYRRIYADFIKDRREKERGLTGYVERHHIVPRHLSGDDNPANLINLSAEDHFFAHLLLAKIYGGRMWAPVALMIGGQRKDYRPIVSRQRYGWAAREMARASSGRLAHQYSPIVHHLTHRDGREWSGTQLEMHELLGIGRSLANMLVKRRVSSAKGWYRAGETPRFRGVDLSGSAHPMYRPERHHFLHVDGRRFDGSQYDLTTVFGLSKSSVCMLVSGKFRCVKGWYVEGNPPIAKTGKGAKYRVLLAG